MKRPFTLNDFRLQFQAIKKMAQRTWLTCQEWPG